MHIDKITFTTKLIFFGKTMGVQTVNDRPTCLLEVPVVGEASSSFSSPFFPPL